MGTDHPNSDEEPRKRPEPPTRTTIETNERERMLYETTVQTSDDCTKHEQRQARQPHLLGIFPEVQTDPTLHRIGTKPTTNVSVETLFLPARSLTKRETTIATYQSYYQSQRVVYSHHTHEPQRVAITSPTSRSEKRNYCV